MREVRRPRTLALARAVGLATVCLAACTHKGGDAAHPGGDVAPKASPTGYAASEAAVPAGGRARTGAGAAGGVSSDGRRGLTIAQARRYMVDLINRDRASMGLPPVTFDEGAPTRAGQEHAEDMAQNGFLGHWGTDGSVPEQRFTEAGGLDMVL